MEVLVLDGHELHPSLSKKSLARANHGVPANVQANPHRSTDDVFVAAVARSASQGQLNREGMRAAIFAIYEGVSEVGFYGLEAESDEHADLRERKMREIWAHNVSLERARVHRDGRVLVLVWHDGVSPGCWDAVNSVLEKRLAGR